MFSPPAINRSLTSSPPWSFAALPPSACLPRWASPSASRNSPPPISPTLAAEFDTMCQVLAATRPTAVNLFWAIERMKQRFSTLAARPGSTTASVRTGLIAEAQRMYDEDIAACRRMGAPRRLPAAQIRRRPHPLQRGSPRHLRLRHRAWRHPLRRRTGQQLSTSMLTKPAPSSRARVSPRGS